MPRDIRSPENYRDGVVVGSEQDDMSWAANLPRTENIPDSIGLKTRIQAEDQTGTPIINPNTGSPYSIRSRVIHNLTEVEKLWQLKMLREPCLLCEHFRPGVITRAEKDLFYRNLIAEHGWTEDAIKGDLGNPDNFEFCELHNILTHKQASCRSGWRPKRTLGRLFVSLLKR